MLGIIRKGLVHASAAGRTEIVYPHSSPKLVDGWSPGAQADTFATVPLRGSDSFPQCKCNELPKIQFQLSNLETSFLK